MDIAEDIQAFFKGQQASGFFLVDVKVLPTQRILIHADSEKGISIDECSALHRRLIEQMPSAGDYEITVSSPGLDEPLKVTEQYKKSIGKNVDVLMLDGERFSGKLVSYDPGHINIEENSKKGILTHTFNLQDIKSTRLTISFKKTIKQ